MLAAVSIVALSAVMYGCVHSGGDDTPPPVVEPEPTAYEAGKAAIMSAATAEAAQAAYDAIDLTMVTGAEAASLQMALADRLAAIATAGRIAAQKMALMDAAGTIDTADLSTQEAVDAARTAIAALRGALAAAADVSDADKAMYQSQLDDAVAAVDTAQGGIDTATRRTNQMAALSSASMTLQTALAALFGATPTQAQLDAANAALAALNMAIADGADLTDAEKATYRREAANAAAPIMTAQMAFDEAGDEAEKAAAAMMAVTAGKLYDGISVQNFSNNAGDDHRNAAYDNENTGALLIWYGAGSTSVDGTAKATLTEDKKTTVPAHHGWTGRRLHADTEDGSYEAIVYSNPEATPGNKFGQPGVTTAATGYQYGLNDDGEYAVDTSAADAQARVESPSFDQGAGRKTFELPDNTVRVMIPGSYHGVSGTYYCTPTGGGTDCSASVAASGFTLAGGTWRFKPDDPNARVTESMDGVYYSYGWWLFKSTDGSYIASSVEDKFGGDRDAEPIGTLRGTARYAGGAVGKYALRSSTGGTNDAGHFTADAEFNATFAAGGHKISGTIDNFMDGDGEMKDWSVELKETTLGPNGGIPNGTTAWTIGGTAAADSGKWTGYLQERGDDGVPKSMTGTFYTEFNDDGRMVGGFGANKQ